MKSLLIFFLITNTIAFSQITFDSPNDLKIFTGSDQDFIVDNSRLKLNAADKGTSLLYHHFKATNTLSLSFELELQFAPSNSNRFSVFLGEDSLYQNGYLLEIGENGSQDAYRLSVLKSGSKTLIKRGIDGIFASDFVADISISLSDSVSVARNDTVEIKTINSDRVNCEYAIIECIYSKSRKDKFFVDNYKLTLKQEQEIKPTSITEISYQKFDVWVTEIMVDPTPTRQLPDTEYIELYNNTDNSINLNNWTLRINQTVINLPEILLDDYMILTPFTLNIKNETVINLPTLNNDECLIELLSPDGAVVYKTQFEAQFKPSSKSSGGYSYELQWMDTLASTLNWDYTTSFTGGTPGQKNSEEENNSLFNRVFHVRENNQITWAGPLLKDSLINQQINGQIDLRLSEVLYRPKEYGSEFIELYNLGQSGLTQDLWIQYEEKLIKIPDDIYIPADSYVILTDNFYGLNKYYQIPFNCVIIELTEFPEILSEATVNLLEGTRSLWQHYYTTDYENSLTPSDSGISLEKTSWIEDTWASGNINIGGATPGAENTNQHQTKQLKILDKDLVFHTQTQEAIQLEFQNNDGSYLIDMSLFSKSGTLLKTIYKDYHLPASSNVSFMLNNEELGFYFIYLEFKNENGDIQSFKKPVVVAY